MKKVLSEKLKLEKENPSVIIITVDKDLDNTPGWHYNFVKKEKYWITEEEGIRNFYKQLLTGDAVDNIKGIKGIGPKRAEHLLGRGKNEKDYYSIVLQQYRHHLPYEFTGVNPTEQLNENAQLLWIMREEGKHWSPPNG